MKPAAVAIGMFDGVHAGHRHVLSQLVETARKRNLVPAVVTFDRHPMSVIRPERVPGLIMSLDRRVELLESAGVRHVEVLHFDQAMRQLTACQFARTYLRELLDTRILMLGYDNGFGSDRLKGFDIYAQTLAPLGIEVVSTGSIPRCLSVTGADAPVSSSLIRRLIAEGQTQEAGRLLGSPFSLDGLVVTGRQLGRTIGFPTANLNIDSDRIIPLQGVYAAQWGQYPAVLNIGTAPTVNGSASKRLITEVHVISPRPLPDLYGTRISVDVLKRLRDEQHFENLELLRQAIERDRDDTIAWFKNLDSKFDNTYL